MCNNFFGYLVAGAVRWYHATAMKNFTIRLPDTVAEDVTAMARAEGQSLNATVQMAIAEAVKRRRADPQFRERLQRLVAEDQELLRRLAG